MPLLHSIGLGGGSIVRQKGQDKYTVGPDSVGHNLTSKSRVFGGSILTATDISVVSGNANIGSVDSVKDVADETVKAVQARIQALLEGAIDAVKISPEPLPVLLVGGGSIVAPRALKGASELNRPPFFDVANAVGAAISKVGGTVDIVQNTSNQSERDAITNAKSLAIDLAVRAGASRQSVSIVDVEAIPLQYVSNQVRTIIKAVGDLEQASHSIVKDNNEVQSDLSEPFLEEHRRGAVEIDDEPPVDIALYKPTITFDRASQSQIWQIKSADLHFLSIGMYVLGCAGGGQPASTEVLLQRRLQEDHSMRVIAPASLGPSDVIYWGGHMGSPAVSVERLASTETISAVRALMEYLGDSSFDAIMGLEIGGANGLEPFLLSSYFDRPVIDADWMGRAFPTYHQTTLVAHETGQLVPCAIDSGDGNSIIMTRTSNDRDVDRILRASCTEMGSRVGMAARPTTTDRVQKYGVLNSCSLAWRIGRCIELARQTNTISTVTEAIVDEAGGPTAAKVIFRGKIMAVERRLHKGHSYGEVLISSTGTHDDLEAGQARPVAEGGQLKVPFKNENILAEHTSADGRTAIIATVPDLIAILDSGDGRAVGVPEYKYGVSVVVVGITCSPRWVDTPAALELGGPRAFGFDVEYKPLGRYVEPKSVIDEYQQRD